jgi:hypothetical protein
MDVVYYLQHNIQLKHTRKKENDNLMKMIILALDRQSMAKVARY